jgi:hypothetical protein
MADDATEDDTLINQLLDDGFTYTANGRVDGLATEETDEPDDGEVPAGDPDPTVGESDDTGDDAVDVEPDADTPPFTDTAPPSPSSVLAGLDETEARGILHLRQLLINNPDLAAKVNKVLSGDAPDSVPAGSGEAAPAEPALPEFIDPDDQTAIGLWKQLEKISQRIDPVQQQVQQTAEQANQARIASEISQAVDRFKVAHPDLDDQDIANIRNHTSANVNIPGVMNNFPGDPVEGLTRALEIGSLTDPATRDKVLGTRKTVEDQEAKDKKRMRDQAALSGGTGGASRRPAPKKAPASWNEVAKRLAEAIENGS